MKENIYLLIGLFVCLSWIIPLSIFECFKFNTTLSSNLIKNLRDVLKDLEYKVWSGGID